MRKHLAYYETEWPANIAELTAVENKPFVGYLKDSGVQYTVIPGPVVLPPESEIWYTTTDGNPISIAYQNYFGSAFVSNTYENGRGIIKFNGPITDIPYYTASKQTRAAVQEDGAFRNCTTLTSITLPQGIQYIGYRAFSNCINLSSITIPNSLIAIEEMLRPYENYSVFDVTTCDITYTGTKEEWEQVYKPEYWYRSSLGIIHCTDGDITL